MVFLPLWRLVEVALVFAIPDVCAAPAGSALRADGSGVRSQEAVKARVESGEGVPFFDERFSCRESGVWNDVRELVEYARLRIFERAPGSEGEELERMLTRHVAARTANLTEVLQCNVGVIAAYHLLARSRLARADDWGAYRLLQLALIYVFTLRNALEVPPDAAHAWATRTDQIVREIKLLRSRIVRERERRFAQLPEVAPNLRLPGLRVAVVSICAYPADHPLVLKTVTPENRRLYAERHGYSLHLHLKHPAPDQGVHIQHAKLELVANYLRSGDYDWVAWLDCDSILMNLNKTLDSVIFRYARSSARPLSGVDHGAEDGLKEKDFYGSSLVKMDAEVKPEERHAPANNTVVGGSALRHPEGGASADEPPPGETLETIVSHVGSCNTDAGCNASVWLRVNRQVKYEVTVSAALVDMDMPSERLASVSIGNIELGECNPSPDSDYDCGLFDCFRNVSVTQPATDSGWLLLRVHSVRTHNDCRCSRLDGVCYGAPLAALEEMNDGEKTTDPSYGMFVKFKFKPASQPASAESAATPSVAPETKAIEGVTTATAACETSAVIIKRGAECDGQDLLLGLGVSLEACLSACQQLEECEYVSYGVGRKRGQCFWEMSDCQTFEEDSFEVYKVFPVGTGNATGFDGCTVASAQAKKDALEPPSPRGASEAEQELKRPAAASTFPEESGRPRRRQRSPRVDLLITEEGWGLSSANWVIRRSAWSVDFLERAFRLCHEEMPLFGDQDAMIHLLLNDGSLSEDSVGGDPMDAHAVVVPQRELNAYDALNAHYMGCDGYNEGDLLVTFPGCKDPSSCNPMFQLAADYASAAGARPAPGELAAGAALRLFGPPAAAASAYEAARKRARQAKE